MADFSQMLADKMLQGWCMLNKECSTCGIPIMKSRQGEELCVSCGPVSIPPPAAPAQPPAPQADLGPIAPVITDKIKAITEKIAAADDVMLLQSLGGVLKTYLEVYKLLQEVHLS